MKELTHIKTVLPSFEKIPQGIGQQRTLRELEEQVTIAIMDDLHEIVEHDLKEINITSFIETLQQLCENIRNIPSLISKTHLNQQLRFLILVIKNRQEEISLPEELLSKLEEISQLIGNVPGLNKEIELPAQPFLPRNFTKTVKKWERIIWKYPSRESREEKLEFFSYRSTDHRMASVRLHLIALDQDSKKEEALSYADADFYHIGNLQADHLQSSEDIVKRQMELVAAMNIDPLFRRRMLHEAEGKGYFKEEKGVIYGTKRFYMEYHNCVGNLWLVSAAAGLKKGKKNPIEWLKKHRRFGLSFLEAIGGEELLQKDMILIATERGELLAEAARKWFRETYGEEITTAGYICHQIKEPLLKQVGQAERHGRKRRSVKLMAKITTAARLVDDGNLSEANGDSDRSSSLGSSDAEITAKNLARMDAFTTSRMSVVTAEINGVARDYTAVIKRGKREKKPREEMDDDIYFARS